MEGQERHAGAAEELRPTPSRGRRALFALLAFALALAAAALAAEVVLQLRELRRVRAAHQHLILLRDTFVMHPFLQVEPAPDPRPEVNVNRHGFRGPDLREERTPGSLRVFALGGSTTYSRPIDYPQTWPAQLASRLALRAPGRAIEVENAACDWYSTEHSLIRYLFTVRRFRPDVVLVMHGINDLYRSFSPEWFAIGPYRPDYGHYLGPLIRAQRRSELAAAWLPFQESLVLRSVGELVGSSSPSDAWDPARINPFDPGDLRELAAHLSPTRVTEFPSLASFRSNLALLIDAIRADGARVVLATQPSIYRSDLTEAERARLFFAPMFAGQEGHYPDLESMERGMRLFNEATAAVAREHGVPLVDLAASVPRTTPYFRDDVHMTPAGLGIAADLFADALDRAGYLEPRAP